MMKDNVSMHLIMFEYQPPSGNSSNLASRTSRDSNTVDIIISSLFDLGTRINTQHFPRRDLLDYARFMLLENLTFFLTKRSSP